MRPAGSSRLSGSPTGSRGWRTSQMCSSSTATIAAAPAVRTISRSAGLPSAEGKVSLVTAMMRPSKMVSVAMRSKARSSWAMARVLPGREHVEQRVGHVEHALQRRDADALGRLVRALGAVGEVDGVKAGGLERVGVGGATGDDVARRVAARLQRALRRLDGRRGRLVAVALEEPLDGDVEVGLARGLVGGVVAVVDQLGDD